MKNETRSELTSQRIKEASVSLFAEQGYVAAGVAEICAQAGVSKGAFYHHFPSKNALFLSLFEEWLDALDEMLYGIAEEKLPFTQKIQRMTVLIEEIAAQYQKQLPLLFEFWLQAARDEQVWKTAVAPFQRYQAFFAGLIDEGIREGQLAPVDANAAAQALVSLAIGMLLQCTLVSGMGWKMTAANADSPATTGGPTTTDAPEFAIRQSFGFLIDGLKRYT